MFVLVYLGCVINRDCGLNEDDIDEDYDIDDLLNLLYFLV